MTPNDTSCNRETGEIFVAECPGGKRTREVLEAMIQQHVHTGTTILTDGWMAYRQLASLGVLVITSQFSLIIAVHRLHSPVGKPRSALRGSGHWCSHQSDRVHVSMGWAG